MNRYKTPEAVRHDIDTLSEEARVLVEATAQVADEKVATARKRIAEALDNGKQTWTQLQARAARAAQLADRTVRTHPYQSIAVAFGVGALLALLLLRRRD